MHSLDKTQLEFAKIALDAIDKTCWEVFTLSSEYGRVLSVHVIPRGDAIKHSVSSPCSCNSDQTADGICNVWVHKSTDNRERFENLLLQ